MSAGLAHGPAGVVHVTYCNSPPAELGLFLADGSELVTVGRERQGAGRQSTVSIVQSPDRSCVRKLEPVWSGWAGWPGS